MTIRTSTLALLACLPMAGPYPLQALQVRAAAVPVDDALAMQSFSGYAPIHLSPDGGWVAYSLAQPALHGIKGEDQTLITSTGAPASVIGSDVWVANTGTGDARNVTGSNGSSWGGVWSPDGRLLAYFSDRSGSVGIYLWDAATRETRRLSSATASQYFVHELVQWTPDGRQVVAKLLPDGVGLDEHVGRRVAPEALEGRTVTVFRSRGAAATPEAACGQPNDERDFRWYRGDLSLIDVRTGEVRRVVEDVAATGYWLSPDGSALAYMRSRRGDECGVIQTLYDLYVVPLPAGAPRRLAERIPQYVALASWSPDGRSIAYATAPYGTASAGELPRGDVYVVPADGGAVRNLTPGTHPPLGSPYFDAPFWSPDGQSIYVAAADTLWRISPAGGELTPLSSIPGRAIQSIVGRRQSGRFWSPDDGGSLFLRTRDPTTQKVGVARVDLGTGDAALLFEEERHHPGYSFLVDAAGATVVYAAESATAPADLWIAGSDFADRRRLTAVNPHLDRYDFGESRLVEWAGNDGATLRGVLALPPGHREGMRHPLIVVVYGGARPSRRVFTFGLGGVPHVELQPLWTTRGYAVFFPDMPLSLGTPARDIARSVLPGVDALVERGVVDPERIGLIGMSYGGYSAIALLTQTNRFRAAVSVATATTNMFDLYQNLTPEGIDATAHLEQGVMRIGTTPWQDRERYVENSPFFFLDRVTAPLLLMHGTADPVTSRSSDAVFVAMRRLGKDVTYARYRGEGHVLWGHENARDFLERVLGWFDEQLGEPGGRR